MWELGGQISYIQLTLEYGQSFKDFAAGDGEEGARRSGCELSDLLLCYGIW